MIDIGLNLTSSQFAGEQADLVERARAAGVEALIRPAPIGRQPRKCRVAARWPGYCFSTAGVHPHDAKSVDEATLPALRELAALPRWWLSASAVSTTTGTSPRPVQDAVFDAQLALAAEPGMPVFSTAAMPMTNSSRSCPLVAPPAGAVLQLLHRLRRRAGRVPGAGLHIGVTGWLCDERRASGCASRWPAFRRVA